jgi:hypothetical protein
MVLKIVINSVHYRDHKLCKWLRTIKPDNSEQHVRDLLEAKTAPDGAVQTDDKLIPE